MGPKDPANCCIIGQHIDSVLRQNHLQWGVMQVTVARKLAGLAARGSLPIPSLPGLSGIDRINNWIATHESKSGTNGKPAL